MAEVFRRDNSARILGESAQESLSDSFKQNLHMFEPVDFLAELTQHIPPKGLQLIRRYGLYASRTKGRWYEL